MRILVLALACITIVFSGVSVYQHAQIMSVQDDLKRIQEQQSSVSLAERSAVKSIQAAASAAITSTTDELQQQLQRISGEATNKAAAQLEKRLQETQSALAAKQAQLAGAERKLAGLPELVELDDLGKVYGNQAQGNQQPIEFPTGKGTISFTARDLTLAYVPSTRELAFVRIGKKQSTENAELIRAWISQATDAKVVFGYRQTKRETRPSEYGQYTETEHRKGDMYFKTYLQYERVLESYGRHSMQYTYYVETGSVTRRNRHFLEQYNRRLGS